MIPLYVPRCDGVKANGRWREGCEDCQRRTDRPGAARLVWMSPPGLVEMRCEFYIGPEEKR